MCPNIIDGRTLRGCWFEPDGINTHERAEAPRQILHHWTGGVRGAEGVCDTLRKRRLSINYVTESSGRIVMCADDMTRTAHAGLANGSSIGVENVGLGFAREDDKDAYEMRLGRQVREVLPFPGRQLERMVELTEWLCETHSIPRQFLEPVRVPPYKIPRMLSRFNGVLGHFHVHRVYLKAKKRWRTGWKWDPGTQIFDVLRDCGFREVPLAPLIARTAA